MEFKEWLAKRKLRPSSIKTYSSVANMFKSEHIKTNEQAITDFLDRHKKTYHYLFALKRFIWYLNSEEGKEVQINWKEIKDKLKWKRKIQIKERELEFEEINLLVENLEYPYNDIVILQWEFGARIREILDMRKECLSIDNDSIKAILKTKGGTTRVVYTITKKAKNLLLPHIKQKGFLFPRSLFYDNRKRRNENSLRCIYTKVWRTTKHTAMGVLGKDISTHWFRHSRIIYLYNKGFDLRTIQKFTGHSSLDMLMQYLISAGIDAKKLARKEKQKFKLEWG